MPVCGDQADVYFLGKDQISALPDSLDAVNSTVQKKLSRFDYNRVLNSSICTMYIYILNILDSYETLYV